MAATPDEALRDLLEDAQRRLASIRLEVPALGDGKPASPSPAQWAAAELAMPGEAAAAPPLPPPAARPPAPAPASVRPIHSAPAAGVEPVVEAPEDPAPVERVASAPLEPEIATPPAPERPAPPPTPRTAPAAPAGWRTRTVAAAAGLGLTAAAAAFLLLRAVSPPEGPAAQAEDGRWFSSGEREIVISVRGQEPKRVPLRSTWRALSLTPGWVWGADGVSSTVERVAEDGSGARAFQLDHVPAALFARDPHLWTIDPSRRQARQYLVTESMLGTFLQPLDARRLPLVSPEADLFVQEDGRLLVLERGAAVLSVVDAGQACAVPVPGGARLVSARGAPALVVASGGSRSLRSLPALCSPGP